MSTVKDDKIKVQNDRIIIEPHRPNLKEKLFFLLSGIIVSIPITLLFETLVGNASTLLPLFITEALLIVIFAPIIEEFAKAYPLFYRHGETERSIFILGFLVGLGFGISEFFVYVFVTGVPILLRLPGILFHAASTSIIAYGIAKRQPIRYYSLAVGLHFLNNFSALLDPGIIGFLIANIGAYYFSWHFYKKTSEKFIDQN
jgi:RsiW-degrading membrane proteinase PrsW (M82 family)